MKTGSGNTQATEGSLKRPTEESSIRSKTGEALKEDAPTEAVIRSKILEFLAKGLDSEKIVAALGQVKGLSSFSPANLLKIVQPVVDAMTKSPELSGPNKASAEKLLNFVEKKIEEESKGANIDSKVPTAGNQNPESAQASPNDKQTYAQRVTEAATTNSGRSL